MFPKFKWQLFSNASATCLSGISQISQQIMDLIGGEESDEYGILRPTSYALSKTQELLMELSVICIMSADVRGEGWIFPRGAVTTDEAGGIHIEWLEGNAAIRIVIPSDDSKCPYIYHEHGSEYGAKGLSTYVLANYLKDLL